MNPDHQNNETPQYGDGKKMANHHVKPDVSLSTGTNWKFLD